MSSFSTDKDPYGLNKNHEFYIMCKEGHINKLKKLINRYPNHNFSWDIGLYRAAKAGHLDLVNFLISKGADCWSSGLDAACWGGHLDIVKLMISKGANHLVPGLWSAACQKHWHIVYFLNVFCDINIPTFEAIPFFNKYFIEYLFNSHPKFDKSICFILENYLHLDLIFKIIKYL
jgi:hypothetical protein